MSKILKNTTTSDISIIDTGVIILASSSYTIPSQDYLLWAASSDIITEVGSGNIVVNDGSKDLNISDGIDLIKGIFPTTIKVSNLDGLCRGTDDGKITGTEYIYVNNLRLQILASADREQAITYADFGTKDQRVVRIDYTSATFSGIMASKILTYVLDGNKYKRTSINWIIS